MESLISGEYLMSIDSIICLISGAVIGLLAAQLFKGWGFGLIGNILIGLIGGVLGGAVFNNLDVMNLGDFADPIVAGLVGGTIFVGIAGLLRH
ncbi:MAG: hypothetical protein R3C14_13415 [Caldilineaceae bacterium]